MDLQPRRWGDKHFSNLEILINSYGNPLEDMISNGGETSFNYGSRLKLLHGMLIIHENIFLILLKAQLPT